MLNNEDISKEESNDASFPKTLQTLASSDLKSFVDVNWKEHKTANA